MEVELFGIGQVSMADHQRKSGSAERSTGGTLFIDEIAECVGRDPKQIALVLVDHTFHGRGVQCQVNVDVRIVSSTIAESEEEIA